MNDDSSYKHVETKSQLLLGKDPHVVVKTKFKGTHIYGAVVTQTITARIYIKTGDVDEVIEEWFGEITIYRRFLPRRYRLFFYLLVCFVFIEKL